MRASRPHRPHPVRYRLIQRGRSMASLLEKVEVNYEVGRLYVNGALSVPRDVAERIAEELGEPVPVLFRIEDVRDPEGVAV